MNAYRREFLALFLLVAFTRSSPGATVSAGNVRGYPGQSASVPIFLRATNATVVAAQFDVAFNDSKVAGNGAELGARLKNHVVRSREISPGVRRTLVYSMANAGTGTNFSLV